MRLNPKQQVGDDGAGILYLGTPDSPDEVIGWAIEGDSFPRLVILPQGGVGGRGTILVGDGTTYPSIDLAGGAAAVSSVNGQTGAVTLTYSDVGSDPAGYADSLIAALPEIQGVGNIQITGTSTLSVDVVSGPTFTDPALNGNVSGTGVDTDSTMAANSDTKLASQKATKAALATKQAGPLTGDVVTSGAAATLIGTTAVESLIRLQSLDQLAPAAGNLNLNSKTIINLADPTNTQDAATKAYADFVAGRTIRDVTGTGAIAVTDAHLKFSGAATGTQTLTLPLTTGGAVPVGWRVWITDITGNAARSLTIAVTANTGATIVNGVGGLLVGVPGPYETIELKYVGSNTWICSYREAITNKRTGAQGSELGGNAGGSDIYYPSENATRKAAWPTPRIITSDADATIGATDRLIFWKPASMAGTPRVLTLPAANAVPAWAPYVVWDQSGVIDAAANKYVSISLNGGLGSTDTLVGGFLNQTFLTGNFTRIELMSNGTDTWYWVAYQAIKDREASAITSGRTERVPSSDAVLNATGKFTNKRVKKRVGSTASSGTPAINTDNVDLFKITALATNITSMTSSLTGTPDDGDELIIRIKDNGTSRTITWGASFASYGATLPTATTVNKTHTIRLIWDSVAAVWCCILAVVQP